MMKRGLQVLLMMTDGKVMWRGNERGKVMLRLNSGRRVIVVQDLMMILNLGLDNS